MRIKEIKVYSFDELSEEEKDKDRVIIQKGLEIIGKKEW